jgi:hypothetical protein
MYRGMHDVGIKLDAKIVVDGMFKPCTNISKFNVVFEDCKNLLQKQLNFSLNYIFKNANKAAHVLLKYVATAFHFICWSQSLILSLSLMKKKEQNLSFTLTYKSIHFFGSK